MEQSKKGDFFIMKLCAIQPPYAYSAADAGKSVEFLISELDKCTPECDFILTPEYSNMSAAFPLEEGREFIKKYTPLLVDAAVSAAIRCQAVVALSFLCETAEGVLRNTTRVFDRNGRNAGDFYKQHLPGSEKRGVQPDYSYTFEVNPPRIIEVDGIRLGFLICYDTYFTEYIAHLAHCKPDVVLVSSFQRAERQDILRMLNVGLAFNCNAFVLRSSVSMGEDAEVGGMSMVVSPEGRILAEFGSRVGKLECDVENIHYKYMRSNAFGGSQIRNDQFIEQGRTPWNYRPCGSMTVPDDQLMGYPRVCAHRGFSAALPENTLPSFGAAIALGADEIEMDVRFTRDGVPVISHDPVLERVSNGKGVVEECTFAELRELDFGVHCGEKFSGVKIASFEEVLKKFARHAVFNLHLKNPGEDLTAPYPDELMRQIVALLRKYDHDQHTFFMGTFGVMESALRIAPDIRRCMGAFPDTWEIVERAIEYRCHKVQFFLPYLNEDMIRRAKENGIRCNLFFCDDFEEAKKYFASGIDTILTNDCLTVLRAKDEFLKSCNAR